MSYYYIAKGSPHPPSLLPSPLQRCSNQRALQLCVQVPSAFLQVSFGSTFQYLEDPMNAQSMLFVGFAFFAAAVAGFVYFTGTAAAAALQGGLHAAGF